MTPYHLHAAADVTYTAGTPAVGQSNGGFSAAIGDNGAGDITLTFDEPVDATESFVVFTPRVAAAASGLISFGFTRPDDNTIRVTSTKEGAAGAVSALTDVDFTILVYKRGEGV